MDSALAFRNFNNLRMCLRNSSYNSLFLVIANRTSFLHFRSKATLTTNESSINAEVAVKDSDEEANIEIKCNKSRLKNWDRDYLLGNTPDPTPRHWHQGTLRYFRKLYGKYGEKSNVDPAICWPVRKELDEIKTFEEVAYPFNLNQLIEDSKARQQEKHEKIRIRQEEIAKKLLKLEDMKKEFYNKIQQKKAEAQSAKERKERLIEEVRMHFGYTVDPKDERFKEMLEKKEKEQKKALKEARQKEREQKMLNKLLSKKEASVKDKEV